MRRVRRTRYSSTGCTVYCTVRGGCPRPGGLNFEERRRKEDKVVSFCGGAFMAQSGKPSSLSIPQMVSTS